MPETAELHARLLAHAHDYNPAAHHRSLLGPYRDVLLVWRSKYMSYEQIATALTQHGLKVSPAGVGVFCRRNLSKAEIDRARREQRNQSSSPVTPPLPLAPERPEAKAPPLGPKIARDNY